MRIRFSLLGQALAGCLAAPGLGAQDAPADAERAELPSPAHAVPVHAGPAHVRHGHPAHVHPAAETQLDAIVVTASPLAPGSEDVVQPVEILSGAGLHRRKAATLGQTVAFEPGVQSSYFGPGVGRPIIRGLEGARVQVLQGGMGALDASTVSADHAVGIEPFLADQIEVLKGPATLLHGSGAIGGAVNVVDGRVPEILPPTPSGRAELRGSTGNDEALGMLRLDGAVGNVAWHADAFRRTGSDHAIPGHARAHDHAEEGDEDHHHDDEHGMDGDEVAGRLENSALQNVGGALGASWIGEAGFLGLAVGSYSSLYGIPGGGHTHAGEDPGAHPEHPGEHAEQVRIDLEQTRIDLRGALYSPWQAIDTIKLRLAHNDYAHAELEGDVVGTRFGSDGHEGRMELVHAPLAGWRGAFGVQVSTRDFSAIGHEAFVPASRSRDAGIFLIEERSFEQLKLELGARHDEVRVVPEGALPTVRFDTSSFSAGALWHATPALHLGLGLDHAERAPTAEELFSDGPHLATAGFEVGDPTLQPETARQLELSLHLHSGPLQARAAVFDNRFDDFIHLVETGSASDGLPLRHWSQADARFRGIEAEASLRLLDEGSGSLDLRLFGDRVRGTLAAGGNLPRMAPSRTGVELEWEGVHWRASLGGVRHAAQRHTAQLEAPSAGYTLVDAHLAYHWDTASAGWEVFLDGSNLGNREARVHTSFLRDVAPLPGRSLSFGVRALF